MRILSLLVSDRANIEDKTNKLTIEGVFDTITAPAFPAKHSELIITVVTEGEQGKYHYKVCIKKGDKEIAGIDGLISTGRRHYLVGKFSNIIFSEPGAYIIEANVDNEKAATNLYLKLLK